MPALVQSFTHFRNLCAKLNFLFIMSFSFEENIVRKHAHRRFATLRKRAKFSARVADYDLNPSSERRPVPRSGMYK